jgi:hypothetical protein
VGRDPSPLACARPLQASLTTPSWSRTKRLGRHPRHDEGDVGLDERVAELLLVPIEQIGQLRIAQRGVVVADRIVVEVDEAAD